MEKIYSKVNPDLLLHLIFRAEDFEDGRINIVDPNNFIQCSALQFDKGKTFKPHKHNMNQVEHEYDIHQESWVVLKGKVRCTLYDIDDQVIAEPVLKKGDASFTLHGGHTYTILSNGAKILEYKTGPYFSQEHDKTFIQ